ncbi:MAG TPA: class I SAM-dependent methyltransferase [Terriglobia bacterium]
MARLGSDRELTATDAGDRTGREFWDRWWQRTPLPAPIDPTHSGLKNYPWRSFHRYFEEVFRGEPTGEQRLVEIGCGQSVFLPYFARTFGFKVSGLDQSELGCERARRILEREQVPGEICLGDLFVPPPALVGVFDAAFSVGVVEHFNDTPEAARAVARFLKPGGRMLTIVPNLTGMLGLYQRLLDRALYDAHVVMDRERLAGAHRQAGLEVESAGYLMPVGLEVLNVESWKSRLARKLVARTHTAASRLAWLVDDHVIPLPPNRWTSPYVVCVARKPALGGQDARRC